MNKNILQQKYLVNGMSTRELAVEFKVCQRTILNYLNKYDMLSYINKKIFKLYDSTGKEG